MSECHISLSTSTKVRSTFINFTFRSVIEQPLLSSLQNTQTRKKQKKKKRKVGGAEPGPVSPEEQKLCKSACDSDQKRSASTTQQKKHRSIDNTQRRIHEQRHQSSEEKKKKKCEVRRAMSQRPNSASNVNNSKQKINSNCNNTCGDEHRRWDYYNNGQ